MLTKTYSLQNDFVINHKVNPDRIEQEIRQSAITIALDYTESDDTNWTIYFKADLTSGEWLIVDGIVAAHSGIALVKEPESVYIAGPTTSDGKQIVLPCLFPGNVYLFVCGASDSESERGEGSLFTVTSDTAGDTVNNMDPFLDFVYIAGGSLLFQGGVLGDYFSARIICPATEVVLNETNTGNCTLMDAPACPGLPSDTKLIIPAAGNGTHDVDLTTATPIPSHDTEEPGIGSGFYNWNEPSHGMGRGTLTPILDMTGDYHLVDHEVQLVNFVNKIPILGSGSIDIAIPAVKPKKILPHWHGRLVLHNTGHTGLSAALMIVTARKVTV
jgi:hypothetical protein